MLAHGDLGDLGPVLFDQPLPDPPGGVTLLPRRLAVGHQPLVDQRVVGPKDGGGAPLGPPPGRRDGRGEGLADGAAVNPVPLGQLADREALNLAITPDLLELLHS